MPQHLEMTYSIENGPTLDLFVTYWPPTPATRTSPPEPGDIEVAQAMVDGQPLPASVVEYLLEDHWDAVIRAAGMAEHRGMP